jgi:hypothetical protein
MTLPKEEKKFAKFYTLENISTVGENIKLKNRYKFAAEMLQIRNFLNFYLKSPLLKVLSNDI